MTRQAAALFAAFCAAAAAAETEYALETLEFANVQQDFGEVRICRSVDGNPLRIGSRSFAHGLGTHANGAIRLDLGGRGSRFRAFAGVDAEVGEGQGSVLFTIAADGRVVWESGVMRHGDAAKAVDLDVTGVQQLLLIAGDAGDGIDFDHADWAEAVVAMKEGAPAMVASPREKPVILTPKPAPAPRINGARVVGARPGHPFLFTIPATGDRPMTFAADGLPPGLTLDPATGLITGLVAQAGTHRVTLRATNAAGAASRELRVEIGDRIALTPPMGWNSWNCFAQAVREKDIRAAADQFVRLGLIEHGWTYVNIDDFWQVNPGADDPSLHGPERDTQGRILPNQRFPDMKGLAEYVHGRGLKIGLYSSPGPTTCGGCIGSHGHEEIDARTYAEWGFDYLKYDWCSYGNLIEAKTREDYQHPYRVMSEALRRQPRDIVYSLCQYGMDRVWEWGDDVGGNCWRTTGDITDTWGSMGGIGFATNGSEAFARPGCWNDPDMLVVGRVGWGARLHATKLTPNEQYTHISLWCLLAAPLLIGCDLVKMDDFTLSLLTNDEVLEVDQDPLGRQATRRAQTGQTEVWAKDLDDGAMAVGLFNRGELPRPVSVAWTELSRNGPQAVRDLWRQADLGVFADHFAAEVPRHGCLLIRIKANP